MKTLKQDGYIGIDRFRLIAAFLVIAIHTSPLLIFGDTADFIFTRVLSRTAVPFFLMTSGFFLISRYGCPSIKLFNFVKKTAMIYGVAIVLYIPMNIYGGYFKSDNLLFNIIKDIFFDGTFYHLWYLPAAAIGAVIAVLLIRRRGLRFALVTTAVLYVIGLFGDSYYGLAEQVPFLKGLYDNMFEIFEYTRNGLFFAPIFLVLGGAVAARKIKPSLKLCLVGLGVSLSLMLFEGLILHNFKLQRHDSMYILLIPCMYFLFTALTFIRGRRSAAVMAMKSLALIIYIIHPLVIIAVRFAAKLTGLERLLIDHSLVHYIAVCIFSFAASLGILLLMNKIKLKYKLKYKRESVQKKHNDRAWAELDLDNLRHNAAVLQEAMPVGCTLMAVVKANGYGHGSVKIAEALSRVGVTAFAVATIEEGIELRKNGIDGEILIMGYTNPKRAKELNRYGLIQTLVDYDHAIRLNKQGIKIKVHMKIDSGMHRLGFDANDTEKVLRAFRLKQLDICGIYTHLCASEGLDESSAEMTSKQISSFYGLLEKLHENGISLPKTHMQSSYGLLNYPELSCDYARIGIALYGVLHSRNGGGTRLALDLRPVLSLKARVILVREIEKGECAGYDMKFTALRKTRIALISIGYADGVPRGLCGGRVIINGSSASIVGAVCMDMLMADVTDIIGIDTGDIATLIGRDGACEISAAEVAENADSITNEILSRMGERVKLI